jgi:hypothetical protein
MQSELRRESVSFMKMGDQNFQERVNEVGERWKEQIYVKKLLN